MQKGICVCCTFAAFIGLSTQSRSTDMPLQPHPKFAGACFSVYGRLEQSNGNPSFRIWRAGTNRVLGVLDCAARDESDNAIPANVQKLSGKYVNTPTFGNFRVCPLTKEKRGAMQMVCIKQASNLSLRSSE